MDFPCAESTRIVTGNPEKAVKVKRGETDQVEAVQEQGFSYVDVSGTDLSGIEKKVLPDNSLEAPVKKGAESRKGSVSSGRKDDWRSGSCDDRRSTCDVFEKSDRRCFRQLFIVKGKEKLYNV